MSQFESASSGSSPKRIREDTSCTTPTPYFRASLIASSSVIIKFKFDLVPIPKDTPFGRRTRLYKRLINCVSFYLEIEVYYLNKQELR